MKKYDICIVGGAGHVGLPLSLAFADKKLNVVIYDINLESLKLIQNGIMPFMEEGAEEILKKVINKHLFVTNSKEVIKESEFIIVIIGTPVDEHLNPKYDLMIKFFNEIIPFLSDDQIIILRSTIYPGTTERIRNYLKEKINNIEVCFCPERIAEGKAMYELHNLPQIIAGFEKTTINKVKTIFEKITKDIIELSPLEAELAKLFTNAWRYIQFATANQFYMIAQEIGVDFYNIYNAMTFKYPRTQGFPKPGFTAGPCLFKDTMQISAFTNNKFFLGHSAMLVNEGLPNFIVDQLKKKYKISELNIGILGMAFKANVDDNRESLSYKLKKILKLEAKNVYCSDPYVKNDKELVNTETLIQNSDIIIIGAPHSIYKNISFNNKIVIDIWNFLEK